VRAPDEPTIRRSRGRPTGSKLSIDQRHERLIADPSRWVAEDAAFYTWPFLGGLSVEEALQHAIKQWSRRVRKMVEERLIAEFVTKHGSLADWDDDQFQRDVDATMRKVRKPNDKQVRALLRTSRTNVPTYRRYKRGPPIKTLDEERRRMIAEVHRLAPNLAAKYFPADEEN
jgi:hypothetical protein